MGHCNPCSGQQFVTTWEEAEVAVAAEGLQGLLTFGQGSFSQNSAFPADQVKPLGSPSPYRAFHSTGAIEYWLLAKWLYVRLGKNYQPHTSAFTSFSFHSSFPGSSSRTTCVHLLDGNKQHRHRESHTKHMLSQPS